MNRLIPCIYIYMMVSGCAPNLQTEELRHRVEAVFELPSVEMLFREVVYHRSDDQLLVFRYGRRETLFRVLVRVQAGFDLSRGYGVEWQEGALRVTLPPPEILFTDADDESLYEYFSDGQNIGYLRLQEVLGDRARSVAQTAVRLGILQDASRYARERLADTMTALGVQNWEVVIRPSDAREDMQIEAP